MLRRGKPRRDTTCQMKVFNIRSEESCQTLLSTLLMLACPICGDRAWADSSGEIVGGSMGATSFLERTSGHPWLRAAATF